MASHVLLPSTTTMPASNHASDPTAPPIANAPSRLPSFLQYVDHELLKSSASHNHPVHPSSACTMCFLAWDAPINATNRALTGEPAITSTFLPLSPCGHWVHYRCLIFAATKSDAHHDQCNVCGAQLFQWEGITALVLAERTGLAMEDQVYAVGSSDREEYEEDCKAVENLIQALVGQYAQRKSKYADMSPDLVGCFYNVCDALQRMKKPKARWLKYETQTGLLLFGMLVLIMMRRFLVEQRREVLGTEGWREFEETAVWVQGRILEEVHRE